MNRTMHTVAVLTVAAVMAGGATAFAAENSATNQTHAAKAHAAKAKKAGSATKLQKLTLTGVVAQNKINVAGKSHTCFVLLTATGAKLHLPLAKAGKHAGTATPAIKLADYLGQNVQVVAMGSERKKGDKTVVRVKMLKTIEKLPPTPADAASSQMA